MGLAFDNALVYLTAGPVWGHFKSSTNSGNDVFIEFSNDNGWHPGLAVGTGVEFMLVSNWTVRGEYLFLQFKDVDRPLLSSPPSECSFGLDCRINYAYSAHVVRLGLNYRFGN